MDECIADIPKGRVIRPTSESISCIQSALVLGYSREKRARRRFLQLLDDKEIENLLIGNKDDSSLSIFTLA